MTETIDFDLSKKVEEFTFVLSKKGITQAPTMRVCAAIDISGSMSGVIQSGKLQQVMDQLGAVGIKFDDNGEIDVWAFDDRSDYLGTWTPKDHKVYVKQHIRARGGTAYSPVIRDIASKLFTPTTKVVKEKVSSFFGLLKTEKSTRVTETPDQTPALVLFITDGQHGDSRQYIEDAIRAASKYPVFFTMVGIGRVSDFGTLQYLDNEFDNVGFIHFTSFDQEDAHLYETIVTDKMVNFIKSF